MLLLILLALAPDPAARAREVATRWPFTRDAMLELRREAAAIGDPALRAAVEAQILAPWLPAEAWAYAHPQPGVTLPPPRKGDFTAAPGGPCEDGHHGYPGGLAVHTLANLLHARERGESDLPHARAHRGVHRQLRGHGLPAHGTGLEQVRRQGPQGLGSLRRAPAGRKRPAALQSLTLTPRRGQRSRTTQREQCGRRASQVRRPCQMRSWWARP